MSSIRSSVYQVNQCSMMYRLTQSKHFFRHLSKSLWRGGCCRARIHELVVKRMLRTTDRFSNNKSFDTAEGVDERERERSFAHVNMKFISFIHPSISFDIFPLNERSRITICIDPMYTQWYSKQRKEQKPLTRRNYIKKKNLSDECSLLVLNIHEHI